VFSVAARHGDLAGDYPLFMPQSTEQSVTGGRETFGEPKKLADIAVDRDGDSVTASVTRLGYPLISVSGRISGPAQLPPDQVVSKKAASILARGEPDYLVDVLGKHAENASETEGGKR
jgi:acetoacetate decarboxylase